MDTAMMQQKIERLGPFLHEIELPGGVWTRPPEVGREQGLPPRVRELVTLGFDAIERATGGFEGKRVLEVASNSGGFAVEAARRGASYVLATDVVDRYVEQIGFVRDALDLESVEARKLSVYEISEESVGFFDVVFCFGLLYHLENPVEAVRSLSSVSRHVLAVDSATIPQPEGEKIPLWGMNLAEMVGQEDPERAETSLWRDRNYVQFKPTPVAVRRLMRWMGFDEVRRVRPPEGNPHIRRAYYEDRRALFLGVKT
jgi:SAM-dependent methyltransferase